MTSIHETNAKVRAEKEKEKKANNVQHEISFIGENGKVEIEKIIITPKINGDRIDIPKEIRTSDLLPLLVTPVTNQHTPKKNQSRTPCRL